jgi:hypothetical protein
MPLRSVVTALRYFFSFVRGGSFHFFLGAREAGAVVEREPSTLAELSN